MALYLLVLLPLLSAWQLLADEHCLSAPVVSSSVSAVAPVAVDSSPVLPASVLPVDDSALLSSLTLWLFILILWMSNGVVNHDMKYINQSDCDRKSWRSTAKYCFPAWKRALAKRLVSDYS